MNFSTKIFYQCTLWVKNKKLSLILRAVNNGIISIVKILNFEICCLLAVHSQWWVLIVLFFFCDCFYRLGLLE